MPPDSALNYDWNRRRSDIRGNRRDHASSSPEERTFELQIGSQRPEVNRSEASEGIIERTIDVIGGIGEAIACPLRNGFHEPFVQPSIRLASYFLMSRNTSDNQRVSAPALVLQSSVDLLPDG